MKKEENQISFFNALLVSILIFAVIFEGAVLVIGFIFADEVECNLLWCKFTSSSQETIISKTCYVNGIQVDCKEFSGDEHFCIEGNCSMDGVCPGANKSKNIEDCINEVVEGFN